MKKEEFTEDAIPDMQNLSEKCRISLEKSFGFRIPLPKGIVKPGKEK